MGEHERPVPERDLHAERPEHRRRRGERIEGAEAVVDVAGLDQLARPDCAAGLVLRLDDEHRPTRVREDIRRHEAVVARADHDGVMHRAHATTAGR